MWCNLLNQCPPILLLGPCFNEENIEYKRISRCSSLLIKSLTQHLLSIKPQTQHKQQHQPTIFKMQFTIVSLVAFAAFAAAKSSTTTPANPQQ